MAFHTLDPHISHIAPPTRMNNPMGYVPHPLCLEAARLVKEEVGRHPDWLDEADRGKMFGVMVVERDDGERGFIAAYSGQLCGRADWEYFVPAVYDYLQPDGYFKSEERRIDAINRDVRRLQDDPAMTEAVRALDEARLCMEREVEAYRTMMGEAKRLRDMARPSASEEETLRMTRESQYQKAQLRRLRRQQQALVDERQERVDTLRQQVLRLREERRRRSDDLQQWLFRRFEMRNARGESRSLTEIFAETTQRVPPAGAGECCAPKLLQHAFLNGMTPLCMAEFWWGRSPVGEVRRHGQFYPACRGKCMPILDFMLQGMETDDPIGATPREATPSVVYEDRWLLVVEKPEGMLAVPGKTAAKSVWDFVRLRCPQAEGPLVVHRLDMATSGLMVLAKDSTTHKMLQRQFAERKVKKTYVALLDGRVDDRLPVKGMVDLPLAPDFDDRPRQRVDRKHGKTAVTEYELVGDDGKGHTVALLHPLTGRTHQLRVHCAHADGLDMPILGDNLYGKRGERLCLHAAMLEFSHPATGEWLQMESSVPFIANDDLDRKTKATT